MFYVFDYELRLFVSAISHIMRSNIYCLIGQHLLLSCPERLTYFADFACDVCFRDAEGLSAGSG